MDVVSTTQPVDIYSWRSRTTSDSSYLTVSPTPYITRLNTRDQEDIVNPLTQLAIIATGPQSPLLHNNKALTDYQRYANISLSGYAHKCVAFDFGSEVDFYLSCSSFR